MPKAHRRVFLTFSRLPLVSLFPEFIFAFAWVVRLVSVQVLELVAEGKQRRILMEIGEDLR
jgi:hypothetical protein